MKKNTQSISYLLSITLHIVLLALLGLWNFSSETTEDEYLTIGFGMSGFSSIPRKEVKQNKRNKKNVSVPKTTNLDKNKVAARAKKEREKLEEKKNEEESKLQDPGFGQGLGLKIDWGGKGVRKIYSHVIPPYPDGVNKEIDVKLRFTIFPDGTVGKIIPLRKADSRLESAAINALRKWRFEPIPSGKKRINQTVVIIFPFRLL